MEATSYDEKHMTIVESGFEELKSHFHSNDSKEKASLLFCLERYVDPYYESKINYEAELYNWLSKLLRSDESVSVKEHALDVLMWDSSRNMHACEINSFGELECADTDP